MSMSPLVSSRFLGPLHIAQCVRLDGSGALFRPAFCMTFRVRVRVRFVTINGIIIILYTKRWSGLVSFPDPTAYVGSGETG